MSTAPVGAAAGTSSCHQEGVLVVGVAGVVESSGAAVDCGWSSVLSDSVVGGVGAGDGAVDGCGNNDDGTMAASFTAAAG